MLLKLLSKLITKDTVLENLNVKGNNKRSEVHNEFLGYMPGEIYSFGIVYLFDDGTTSPVFHIPGGSNDTSNDGYTVGGMSSNNKCETETYTSLNNADFWGNDSNGVSLLGKNVRHHRFPLRSVNNSLYEDEIQKVSKYPYTLTLRYTLSGLTGALLDVNYSYDSIEGKKKVTKSGSTSIRHAWW